MPAIELLQRIENGLLAALPSGSGRSRPIFGNKLAHQHLKDLSTVRFTNSCG
jgi:hypothetical protein